MFLLLGKYDGRIINLTMRGDMPLKYENVAKVGDGIRCYLVQGQTDSYVEGVVKEKDATRGCFVIVVERDAGPKGGFPMSSPISFSPEDEESMMAVDEYEMTEYGIWRYSACGKTAYVPMELDWGEFDGRIFNLTTKRSNVPLKYENAAKVGDRIRSYDFHGRTDCYVEGVVQRLDTEGKEKGFAAFVVLGDKDCWSNIDIPADLRNSRVGKTIYVPMECAFLEYDGRIVNLSK